MTKKNLRPQQVAPVQRETTANSSVGEKGVNAHMGPLCGFLGNCNSDPFAGDDAE